MRGRSCAPPVLTLTRNPPMTRVPHSTPFGSKARPSSGAEATPSGGAPAARRPVRGPGSFALAVSILTFTFGVALAGAACSRNAPVPPESPGATDAAGRTGASQALRPEAVRPDAVRPEYDEKGKLQKLEYDRNGDGTVDTWGYMDGPRVVRVEVDENGDGKVDRWEYHRAPDQPAPSGPGSPAAPQIPAAAERPDRTVERVERATRFDGRVSRIEYFAGGVLTRIEEDTDGDGRTDKWETYTDGALAVMALDTSGRGKADRRLVYRADGSLDRIEADPSGSGEFRPVQP